MDFNKEEMLRKYKELRDKYIETYVPDLTEEGYTVYYARIPDPCLPSDLCSHKILHHIEAQKALFPRLYKKLPKGANEECYATLYFTEDGKLHHLESPVYDYKKTITFCISDQLQADYIVVEYPGSKREVVFLSFEWTEYDADGNTVSVESFSRNGCILDGVKIDSEYYQYENGKLVHADYFKEFDSDGVPGERLLLQLVPDKIVNPGIFAYDFSRTDEGVLCTKTSYYSKSKTFTQSIQIPEKELKKMEDNGIRCFL